MGFRRGVLLALAAILAVGGCATGTGARVSNPAPPISPIGKVYPPGVRPTESRYSRLAMAHLERREFTQALEQAQLGIRADSANPRHYLLAAQAEAGAGRYAEADRLFARAEQIYPAYELETEPLREEAWAQAFERGVQAYNAGDAAGAVAAWEAANRIYALRHEAHRNLAALFTQHGEYQRAIDSFRAGLAALDRLPATRQVTAEEERQRVENRASLQDHLAELLLFTGRYDEAERLFRSRLAADSGNVALQSRLAAAVAAQAGREAEAQALYTRLLAKPGLSPADYLSIGTALFKARDYSRAADAFARVAIARPNSRDVWFNYANALYAAERWGELVPVGERLARLDPLSEDAAQILAQAYRRTRQEERATQALQSAESMPIRVRELEARLSERRTTIRGKAVGHRAARGMPVQLRFVLYAPNGEAADSEVVSVNAPAKGEAAEFEVTLDSEAPAADYRYELVR